MTKVAIFDRDATLIDVVRDEEIGAITVAFHPDQIRILPGAIEGMRLLADAGFLLALATNQPGPAKGQITAAAVMRTNLALAARLADAGVPLAGIEVCMHHPEGGPGGDPALVMRCGCRKPKPGMLNALLARLGASAEGSWMIGDSRGDVEAGQAAGVRTGLVFATNRCELCPLRPPPDGPPPANDLAARASAFTPDAQGVTVLELARAILRLR